MPEFRMTLAASFLYRFHLEILTELGLVSDPRVDVKQLERGISSGLQFHANQLYLLLHCPKSPSFP